MNNPRHSVKFQSWLDLHSFLQLVLDKSSLRSSSLSTKSSFDQFLTLTDCKVSEDPAKINVKYQKLTKRKVP